MVLKCLIARPDLVTCQGSIVATANSAGTSTVTLSYGPYGEPNATTGVRFRYTGQQLLGPLNLYYYKARMYSPAIGRFLQTDPIGYQDGLNLYAYVGNNPFNRNDPSGLIAAEARMLSGGLGGQVASFGLGFTPAGVALDAATLITGRDVITGESVPRIWAVAGIIPGVSELRKAGNAVDGAADFYRGAKPGSSPDFTPRPNDFKVDQAAGTVKPTHGVSVFDNPNSVSSKGYIPNKVDQSTIPDTLQIIQRGGDKSHFEITPKPGANLTPQEFIDACSKIKCSN